MRFLLLLLAQTFFISTAHADLFPESTSGVSCARDTYLVPLPTKDALAVKMMKDAALDAATRDLKTFCEWNRMDRLAAGTAKAYEYREEKFKGKPQAENHFLKDPEFQDANAWHRSMSGPKRLKDARRSATFLYHQDKPATADDIIDTFSRPVPESASYGAPVYESKSAAIKPSLAEKTAGCIYFATTSVNDCISDVNKVEKFVEVKRSFLNEVTGAEILTKVLSGRAYTEGVRSAALIAWKRIKSGDASPNANIFDDIKSGFKEAGANESEATDKTWDVLAAIATGGANFMLRGECAVAPLLDYWPNSLGCTSVNVAPIQALAEAMTELDTLKMDQKNPSLYSLPANVHFPCDSGKSYHFWMNAYLARKLALEGSSEKAAQASLMLAHMGYVMGGARHRRAESTLSPPRFGTIENASRIDLALTVAGAKFGTDSASGINRDYNLENGYRAFIKAGGNDATPEDKSGFSFMSQSQTEMKQWLSNMNPKFMMNYFDK